jgi:hypothetical protein
MAEIDKESQFCDALPSFLAKVGESKAHWYGIAVDRGKAQGIRFYADKFTNFLVVSSLESVCDHTMHYVAGLRSQQHHFIILGCSRWTGCRNQGQVLVVHQESVT